MSGGPVNFGFRHTKPLPPAFYLYTLSVVGSGCGFVTQMLVSGYWSTTFSADIFHFSVNLAFYFLALGAGSLLANRWKSATLAGIFLVVVGLCAWTGLSIALLRLGIQFGGEQPVIPIAVVIVAGVLTGTLIPLAVRLGHGLVSLPTLFFLDYSAAIFFTTLFTFGLLIPFGYGRTALILSVTCLAVTMALWWYFNDKSGKAKPIWALATAGLLLPTPIYVSSFPVEAPFMSRDSTAPAQILFSKQSHYQKIVLTEEKKNNPFYPHLPQHVLYLDGFIQFSTVDEIAYHICLADIPVAAFETTNGRKVESALILGGGDGLAARNLLAVASIKKITLVELDPEMLRLSRENPVVKRYNLDSLHSKRVEVINTDAFTWARRTDKRFDLIVIDFPLPKNLALSRLFSAEFYSSVMALLAPGGFVSIQAGPASYWDDHTRMMTSEVTTCLKKSLAAIGYPSFEYITPTDQEAFLLVTNSNAFSMDGFAKKLGIDKTVGMGRLCVYNPNWREPAGVQANTLNNLSLTGYAAAHFHHFRWRFYNYKDRHAVFLPD